jgi:hypothetical protein
MSLKGNACLCIFGSLGSPEPSGLSCWKSFSDLLPTCFMLVSFLAYSSTMKMAATCSSETSVGFQQTMRHYTYIPDGRTLQKPMWFPCNDHVHMTQRIQVWRTEGFYIAAYFHKAMKGNYPTHSIRLYRLGTLRLPTKILKEQIFFNKDSWLRGIYFACTITLLCIIWMKQDNLYIWLACA